nr:unnamed protein product [Digitaria exilis]
MGGGEEEAFLSIIIHCRRYPRRSIVVGGALPCSPLPPPLLLPPPGAGITGAATRTAQRSPNIKATMLHHHSALVTGHPVVFCPRSRIAFSSTCNKANSRTFASTSTDHAKLLLLRRWPSTRRPRTTPPASGQSLPGYSADDADQSLNPSDNISFAAAKEAVIGIKSGLDSVGVRSELILLALPAVLGQAIDPMAQLMETAYIGRLVYFVSVSCCSPFAYVLKGALELASAGIGVSIFNIVSKIFNIPLLSIATSFVAEDISKSAIKHPSSGKLELTSVSSALILAAGIGIIEALALFLGSGLFLKLMGVSPRQVPGGFQLGITGAAISTVVSQYIITILLLRSLSKRAVLLPPRIDQLEFGGYLKSGKSFVLPLH